MRRLAVAVAALYAIGVPALKLPEPGDENKTEEERCACLNFKATYDKKLVACGQGLEYTRVQRAMAAYTYTKEFKDLEEKEAEQKWGDSFGKSSWTDRNPADLYKASVQQELQDMEIWWNDVTTIAMAHEEFCNMSFSRLNTNRCVKTAMEMEDGSDWWNRQWCYVDPSCDVAYDVPYADVGVKICRPEEKKLGDLSALDLQAAGQANKSLAAGFWAKIAYPFFRECSYTMYRSGRDLRCSRKVRSLIRRGEVFVMDNNNDHLEGSFIIDGTARRVWFVHHDWDSMVEVQLTLDSGDPE